MVIRIARATPTLTRSHPTVAWDRPAAPMEVLDLMAAPDPMEQLDQHIRNQSQVFPVDGVTYKRP